MAGTDHRSVGRSYTAGRRQPYLIRKWPGSRWTLPLGPYTLTQLALLVGSIYLLVKTRMLWAHFGPGNLLIGVGLPAALTYAARRTRIEGRDPVRTLLAAATYLLQPRAGYLRGQSYRTPAPVTMSGRGCVVAELPAAQLEPARVLAAAVTPAAPRPRTVGLAELLATARTGGR
ncbi:hypothetical protein [Actinoplanes sp. G11-F43]|uniref:hypothetical protein n=1 Tax=Actinoplanes sp. G11-F43 TaxID=3424130 RepID=UPI003D349B2F